MKSIAMIATNLLYINNVGLCGLACYIKSMKYRGINMFSFYEIKNCRYKRYFSQFEPYSHSTQLITQAWGNCSGGSHFILTPDFYTTW